MVALKVTQASLNQTALDWPRNMANIYTAIDEAARQGSDILALEELALTGYEANDEFQRTDNRRILAALDDVSTYAQALDPNLIISIGHPWRLQMRAVEGPEDAEFERAKNPLYDRMNLPFNVQSLINNGRILGMTAKGNLYNDERGYEKRYFNEWSVAAANAAGGKFGTIEIPLTNEDEGNTIPFGRPIIWVSNGINNINLAHAICEEKWVATRYDGHPHDDSRYETDNIIPAISNYLRAKDGLVLLIPNASPPARDKNDKHVHLAKLASRFADVVIDTDGLGSSGSTFAQFGHRLIVRDEKLIAQGTRLNFNRVATTTTTVNVKGINDLSWADHIESLTHGSIDHEFKNAKAPVSVNIAYEQNEKDAWDSPENPNRHYEEIIRYTALWLFDYMRKTGAKGIMEALSGGADSAFNSTIISVMVHLGMNEMGVEKFCDELGLKNKAEILAAEAEGGMEAAAQTCLQEMLTGVYMGTSNSSKETRHAAEFLMKGGIDPETGEQVQGIGGKFVNRNVQDLLDFYGTMYAVEDTTKMDPSEKHKMMTEIAGFLNLSPHTTTPEDRAEKAAKLKARYPQIEDLTTAADGIAYENIQARGREVLIMLFANKEGKRAVANPNLDEARNAYATFGGDLHSGTINLNNHLPKSYQLGIMDYLYKHGVHAVMKPIRSLGPVLKNKPTAELQPKNADGQVVQSDEEAMQRSFEQMNKISELILYEREHTEGEGARRLNAGEVFKHCQRDELFQNVDENTLYNMVRVSYVRWGISQHKIHAGPIGPTFGKNVDHQTSQRTPNISGNSKEELCELGMELMFKWAEEDGIEIDSYEKDTISKRAWQDETFVKAFGSAVWSGEANRDYNLRRVYNHVKENGWDSVFPPLPETHPIARIQQTKMDLTP